MNTPICDFTKKYAESNSVRMHMPGHKGKEIFLGEKYDITEIDGADELFMPEGIIKESEENATEIFGARTFYSCGGSTLCIQAMLYLIMLYSEKNGKPNKILAGRNAHRAFINAASLLDTDVVWLYGKNSDYISCDISAEDAEREIIKYRPTAMYITSPDYLGNTADIKAISQICKKYGVLLAVDCAHGAYLKFLPQKSGGYNSYSICYPTDSGADICCSSAHKTLPVLTGGAYLHIAQNTHAMLSENAKRAMALFASTSPSYLILQSLDAFNSKAETFKNNALNFVNRVEILKEKLLQADFELAGSEPFKITLLPKQKGYTGTELAQILKRDGIYPEFYDSDNTVLMLSPENSAEEIEKTLNVLLSIKTKNPIKNIKPEFFKGEKVMSLREAVLGDGEIVPVEEALGQICADTGLHCPPAVPIVMCGEKICKEHILLLKYYGKNEIRVK